MTFDLQFIQPAYMRQRECKHDYLMAGLHHLHLVLAFYWSASTERPSGGKPGK